MTHNGRQHAANKTLFIVFSFLFAFLKYNEITKNRKNTNGIVSSLGAENPFFTQFVYGQLKAILCYYCTKVYCHIRRKKQQNNDCGRK